MTKLLKVSQVAELLAVHPQTVYELVESGDICHTRVGRAIRFTEEQIQRFVAENEKRLGGEKKSPRPKKPRKVTPTQTLKHLSLD